MDFGVLKLDVAFLYDLLGASQEHKVKPKKFAQTDIDEVIIGHDGWDAVRAAAAVAWQAADEGRDIALEAALAGLTAAVA